jgi:FkbM family methyltransferase
MTEEEWLACTDPQAMLNFLRSSGLATERKLRLFAVACCRRLEAELPDQRSWDAVHVAERYADGGGTEQELTAARSDAEASYGEDRAAVAAAAPGPAPDGAAQPARSDEPTAPPPSAPPASGQDGPSPAVGVLSLLPSSARTILFLGFAARSGCLAFPSSGPQDVAVLDFGEQLARAPGADLDRLLMDKLGGAESEGLCGPFDAVVCDQALEYLRDPLGLLRCAHARLAPHGVLLATIPTVRHQGVLRSLLDGDWPFGATGTPERDPIRFFTRRLIEQLLHRARFSQPSVQALADPGHEDWVRNGRPREVRVGGLHVSGLSEEAAEEFFASRFAVKAEPAPAVHRERTSIVILTHNQLPFTRRCLDSIRRCTDEPHELIVVDNGSTDGTVEYLHSLAGVKVIVNAENRGFPAGCNQGIRAATGRQVLLLNNDTVVTTGWLDRLLRALESDPRIGLVGPCSNFVSGGQRVAVAYGDDLLGLEGFAWDWGKAHDGVREDVDRLVGFCLLIRREAIDWVGLLDERFGVGCFEDDDYSRRAARAGYRLVIARDAFVHHFGGRTFLGAGVDYDALMRTNRELYRKKWEAEQDEGEGGATFKPASETGRPAGLHVLVVAHVDRLKGRMDKSHYYRYEALARRPGVTLFGPGLEGYRPGMSVREAVDVACGGVTPDVILHGADLKESGIPLLTGLEEVDGLTAIELLDSWAREDRQVDFINRLRFDVGLIQEAGPHIAFYQKRCPGTEFFWTPNAVDTRLFRNYGLPKEYDVILYGAINPEVYPLRARLARLLARQPGIRFRHIAHPGYYPPASASGGILAGADLSREINKAWVGIATRSVYDCLLMKYLEIPASYALVAGDMPEHGRPLFGGDFIELGMGQSDEEILAALRAHLLDKDRLVGLTDAAHRRILREHSTDAFADRVLGLLRGLLARRNAPARLEIGASTPAETQSTTAPSFKVRAPLGDGLLLDRSAVQLSLCMIARDNVRTLKACLESIRPWVDEMVVVDTGSEDDTPRIAERLGARVFHFPWPDSFSVARNESLRHARGRWIFWMDSDDVIDAANGRALRQLALRDPPPSVLGYLMQVHCPGPSEGGEAEVTVVDQAKLFRNLPGLHFEGRVHEQILPAIRRAGGEAAWTDLFVVHAGCDHSPPARQRKLERDLRLLHLELQERPEHPFTLFNLGMTYTHAGRCGEAMLFLRRSLSHANPAEAYLRKAHACLSSCYERLGRPREAWEACQEGLRRFPRDAELRFRKAVLLHGQKRLEEAAGAYRELLQNREDHHLKSVVQGITGYLARHNLAFVYADAGDAARAEEQWRLVVREKPGFRPGWRGLGEALLRQGKRGEARALAQELLAGGPHLQPEGSLLKGKAAAAQGAWDEARRELERAAREGPEDREVLEALCRLLLERGDLAAAEGPSLAWVRCDPQSGAAHHSLGTVYLQTGRADQAAAAFRVSLQRRPHSAPTQVLLGRALQASGHVQEAAEAWREAMRLNPGDSAAAELLREAGQPLPEEQAAPGPSRGQKPPGAQEKHSLRLRERTAEVRFITRGVVDRAIVRDLWERDVYGVRAIAEPPATVVDVGAHIGAFSILALESWPGARIIACEPDPENCALLRENLRGRRNVETVEAAVVGGAASEVEFHSVADKAAHNSGGGSCVRTEPGSVKIRVPALSVLELWRSKHIVRCDLLKLDCEGAETWILQALAKAGRLGDVRLILGEWHALDGGAQAGGRAREELHAILRASHEVVFNPPLNGTEGHFTARVRKEL